MSVIHQTTAQSMPSVTILLEDSVALVRVGSTQVLEGRSHLQTNVKVET